MISHHCTACLYVACKGECDCTCDHPSTPTATDLTATIATGLDAILSAWFEVRTTRPAWLANELLAQSVVLQACLMRRVGQGHRLDSAPLYIGRIASHRKPEPIREDRFFR